MIKYIVHLIDFSDQISITYWVGPGRYILFWVGEAPRKEGALA